MAEPNKRPRVTKMVAGKPVDVPLEEIWNSLCKVVRLARIASHPSEEQAKYREYRLALLHERLDDLDNRELHQIAKESEDSF